MFHRTPTKLFLKKIKINKLFKTQVLTPRAYVFRYVVSQNNHSNPNKCETEKTHRRNCEQEEQRELREVELCMKKNESYLLTVVVLQATYTRVQLVAAEAT